uniref:Uncharacterized protein n=1 Tax=Xenopus tropicalis TaxID=8364 RepID=A0A6I8PPT9_XENTR
AYRERTKPECISSMLNQAITSNYTVYATLGTAEFFEFELKNPYKIANTLTYPCLPFCLPFILLSHNAANYVLNKQVSFKTSDGKVIAILQVKLTFLKKSIRLPPWYTLPGAPVGTPGGEPDLHVCCSDINIICDSKKCVICIDLSFSILSFRDPWLAAPIQIWQIYVHSLKRIDVSCITGQLTQLSLVLRGTQVVRKVRSYSSHPEELKVDPDRGFVFPPNGIQDLHIGVRPQKAGSKFIYLNLVDVDQHQLVASWLVCVSCRKPVISKAFEILLPVGGEKGSNKRISYRNPYPTKKTYSLHKNRIDLPQFKENYCILRETYSIGLCFAPSQTRGLEEILIFINNREDKNEETFHVKVR